MATLVLMAHTVMLAHRAMPVILVRLVSWVREVPLSLELLALKVRLVTQVLLVPLVENQLVFRVPKVHEAQLVLLDTLFLDNSHKVLLDQLVMENLGLLVQLVVMETLLRVLKFILIQ
jgi:hypothetical protein